MQATANKPFGTAIRKGPSGGEGRGWSLPLSTYGLREIVGLTVIAAVVVSVTAYIWIPAVAFVMVLWLAALAFFRDPMRRTPIDARAFVAPADGKVTEITPLPHDERLGGPAIRIGIFLSVFDVHINRSPCEAVVRSIEHKAGRFLNAMSPDSSTQNESNTIVLDGGPLGLLVVKQIAGLIARRIVCAAAVGDRLAAGQRFGMIKFGSRTELVLSRPDEVDVVVRVGDKVRAGRTIVARRRAGAST